MSKLSKEQNEVEVLAKSLYYKHTSLILEDFPFMWGQCSAEYREAWRVIARADLEELIKKIRGLYSE